MNFENAGLLELFKEIWTFWKHPNEMLSEVRKELIFLKRIITGQETWVYDYQMETKQQASERRLFQVSIHQKDRVKASHKSKYFWLLPLIIVVWCSMSFPLSITVTKEYNLEVIRHLRESIRRKWPDLAPCDFLLFPKLKLPLCEKNSESIKRKIDEGHPNFCLGVETELVRFE